MSLELINIGEAPDDKTGEPLRDALDKVNRNFAQLGAVIPIRYAYSSDPALVAQSLAHQPCAVGDLFRCAYTNTNKIPGSGGLWECVNNTAGVPSDGVTAVNSRCIMQGLFGQFALIEARPNVAQMHVNTNNGTSQQGRFNVARDVVKGAPPNRRKLYGEGRYVVGGTIDMQHASFDFSRLLMVEQDAGLAAPLMQVGDPPTGQSGTGLADTIEASMNVEGINQGANSTSGPNGTPGFDFQGSPGQNASSTKLPSLATGVSVNGADSMGAYVIAVARVARGVHVWGNSEKQHFDIRAAYCGIAIQDDGPSTEKNSSGTPDTNRYRLVGNQCKQWFIAGADTTGTLDINAESRLVDGSTIPAAYDANRQIPKPGILFKNGKRWKVQGELRGDNGSLIVYVDRDTPLAGFGSDTITINGLSTVHTYGTVLLVDRVTNLEGVLYAKDIGPGRLNFADTTSALPGAAIHLNRIDGACPFVGVLADCGTTIGVQIGDVDKGLFPTGINFGGFSINMRATTGHGLVVNRAVRCRIPLITCTSHIRIDAAVVDCVIEVPADFVRKALTITKDAAATCSVRLKGALTKAQLVAIGWAFEGLSIDAVSDQGGAPAFYTGGAWRLAATVAL